MEDLRRLHKEGKLTADAARWMAETKPVEELYDVEADPHETWRRIRKAAAGAGADAAGARGLAGGGAGFGAVPEGEILREEKRLGSRYAILRNRRSSCWGRCGRLLRRRM